MDYRLLSGLLNPLRMKIMQVVMTHSTVTKGDIAEELANVPPATLYRHLNKMVEDNILEVCGENKKRGTYEKIYQIKKNPLKQAEEAAVNGDANELYNIYYTFIMNQLLEFNNYLKIDDFNLEADRVGFRSYSAYMSDDECDTFIAELKPILGKISSNKYEEGRRLRKFSFTLTPIEERKS